MKSTGIYSGSVKPCLFSKTFSLAPDFKNVQKEVSELIKGRILIGHAVHHDLKVHVENESYYVPKTCTSYLP